MTDVAESIVANMLPEEVTERDDTKETLDQLKQSAASSFVEALKAGEPTRVATVFQELYDLCSEAKEYGQEEV